MFVIGPPYQMLENNNQQNFQQPAAPHQSMMSSHGPLSVEELEARLRVSGASNTVAPNMERHNFEHNQIQSNKSATPQQQDMIAFKKLVNDNSFIQ